MELQPIYERVLVEVIPTADKTDGGLILPEESKEVSNKGIVIAQGEHVKNYVSNLKEGDTIMFMKFSGMEMELNGKPCRLILANDILGIIKE